MVRSSWVAVVSVFVAVVSGGCSSASESGNEDECRRDSDCEGSQVCEDGECVKDTGKETTTTTQTGQTSCTGSETQCVGTDAMNICSEGSFVTATCADYCGYFGFAPGTCSDGACGCGDPIDATCVQATNAMCTCGESIGSPCSNEQTVDLYIACHTGDPDVAPTVLCMGGWVTSENTIDCGSALDACL